MEATLMGLGTMGVTLARLLLRSGWRVTVWNRTAGKADALVREGATLASSAEQAVLASPLVVMCVKDYQAANDILQLGGVGAAMEGRTLVQLSTGSPQEATEMEAWAHQHRGQYLDGAIQAAPSQMGQPDTPILVSGATSAFRQAEPLLKVFGGGISNLGERASLACAMDLATLSYIYGSMVGFLQGALVAESEGLGVDVYGALVAGIAPSFGEFLRHEGQIIHSGNFAAMESPLRISVDATERIARHAGDSRLHRAFPDLAAALFRQAEEAGLAHEEAAALIKVMRQR